jgi:hypothetical protein
LEQAALCNIQNHINAVGEENLEVRVVLHESVLYQGRGIETIQESQGNGVAAGPNCGWGMGDIKFVQVNENLAGYKAC